MPNKTQNYASAFKGSLSPCKKNGHYWNATGGTSLFELYTSFHLKNAAYAHMHIVNHLNCS